MASDKPPQFGEFDLINTYFLRGNSSGPVKPGFGNAVLLGIGDDCALLDSPPSDHILAVTTDMLVENRHFFRDTDPFNLGHKSLAVNLSDLAAMGAKPVAYTLSIALPAIDHSWLSGFSKGLHTLADAHACSLIGGDTTAGPLTICITALGFVPRTGALRRDGAQAGDDIWVSGAVGDARYILGILRQEWPSSANWEAYLPRLHAPQPRVALGLALRAIAHSAIDISDGLLGDLRHILDASKLSASIYLDQVPISPLLNGIPQELRRSCSLRGGDDYELCFTASPLKRTEIEHIAKQLDLRLTKIGQIHAAPNPAPIDATQVNIQLIDENGQPLDHQTTQKYLQSFDHFQSN